jgi:hypothetical protein
MLCHCLHAVVAHSLPRHPFSASRLDRELHPPLSSLGPVDEPLVPAWVALQQPPCWSPGRRIVSHRRGLWEYRRRC